MAKRLQFLLSVSLATLVSLPTPGRAEPCGQAQAAASRHDGPVMTKRTGRDATEAFNALAGQIATSGEDARRQSAGQPTLAQEAGQRIAAEQPQDCAHRP